jgi:hypothetical protein
VTVAERVARNEGVFREVNERINELAERHSFGHVDFICECSRLGCREVVDCPPDVYEQVRANPRRFILAPGHVDSRFESVVHDGNRYVVVEKHGEAGAVAERENPR